MLSSRDGGDSSVTWGGPIVSHSIAALIASNLHWPDGSTVPAGTTEVSGYAYTGDDRGIARVDVSLNQGEAWVQAERNAHTSTWTWRL